MPCKRAEKARKTRPVNSKEGRASSTEIVTRNLRSTGLKDGVPSPSKACDAAEVPELQHVENQDTDPALCTTEIDKKYIQLSVALQVCNEDNQTCSVTLSGNLPVLNCTSLARNSFAMECTQNLKSADTLLRNEYFEDMDADVSDNITREESNIIEDVNTDTSDNITRKREESNIIEDVNTDMSDNITSKREESNIIEDVNTDTSDNITRKNEEGDIIEDMNTDVSGNITGKREESNIIENVAEKSNDAFQNQSDSCLQLQHDNVCKASRQEEYASKDIKMTHMRIGDINCANTDAVNKKVIHNDEDNCIDRDLSSILQENTTKSVEDITNVFLSQTKQSSPGVVGRSLRNNATRASPKLRLLKRKGDNHLFSSQPQVTKFKPPSTMNISNLCYNSTDLAHYQHEDLGTHNDSHIQYEGICDTVVVVDAEAVQRNVDCEDTLSYHIAISQNSCTGDKMEKDENGFPVIKDVKNSQNTEGDHLATTQCWYPDNDKMGEELSLSYLQGHNKVHEKLSLSHLPDCATVQEKLSLSHLPDCATVQEKLSLSHLPDCAKVSKKHILPQQPDHAKVQDKLSLVTNSEISEQEHAVWLKDGIKDIASVSEIRSEVQQDLDKAANSEGNQMLTSASPLQIIQGVNYTDLDKDKAETITDLSKPMNTSLTNMDLNQKLNQNSTVSNEEQGTIEANDSEQAMTCLKGSSGITNSTRCTTDMLDHPTEIVLTDVHTSSYVSAPFNGITAAFSDSVLKHNDKEELTFTTTQEFVMNMSVCAMDTSHGNHMENVQHQEKEDLACISTQEFTTNDLVVKDFISQERIEHVQLIHGSMMTALIKDDLYLEENMNETTVDMACKIDPSSCSNMKEVNNSDTFCQEQICHRSGYFSKEDISKDNKCASVNKLTNSDAVKTHGEMFSLEDPEMCKYAFHNQDEGILGNKNYRGGVIVNSSIHTDVMTAHSLLDVCDNTKCLPLPSHTQTVCDKFGQGPQSHDRLIPDDTSLESGSLIAENLTNQICSNSSKHISSPLFSSHNTNIRERQLNEHSGSIQKCSLKLSVTNKHTNQATEDGQLENSDSFGESKTYAGVIPYISTIITETDPSIPKKNEMGLDNKNCITNMRSINASFCSDTKPYLTSRKTDLNVETFTSEQRTVCLPNTSEKCNLENCQELSDHLDCYSLSDLQETSGMQSNSVCNEESKKNAVQPLSDHKGTSKPSNSSGSTSQGIFYTPLIKPGSHDKYTTGAVLNNAAGISGMQKTLPKLSTMDSITYLSDSQICQLASEDFEHAFNSNEAEDSRKAENVHTDNFKRSFRSAQTRSVRDIEQRKAEGKKLVDAVMADLVSVNKQLLRMKREMETVKRVVQQQHNRPRQSFNGKHEFGFRYQN